LELTGESEDAGGIVRSLFEDIIQEYVIRSSGIPQKLARKLAGHIRGSNMANGISFKVIHD